MIIQKCLETRVPLTLTDQTLLVDERRRHTRQTKPEKTAQTDARAHPSQKCQRGKLKQTNYQPVGVAQQHGRGFDADLDIVVAIDHGVLGIVGDGPQQIGKNSNHASTGTSPKTAPKAIGIAQEKAAPSTT